MGDTGEGGQEVHSSSYKISKSWEVMYTMMTVANNTILSFGKLIRE